MRHQTPLWKSAQELIRHASGATEVIVNMPMGSWVHRRFYSAEAWSRYRAQLQSLVTKEGALFLVASAWTGDEHFADGRHVKAQGAMLFCERLAGALARELKARPPVTPR